MKNSVFHWIILSPSLSCTYEWYKHSRKLLGQEIRSNYDIHSNCPVELIDWREYNNIILVKIYIASMHIKQWKIVFSTGEYFCLHYHIHMNDINTLVHFLVKRSYLTMIALWNWESILVNIYIYCFYAYKTMKKSVFHWRILLPSLSCTYEWSKHSRKFLGQEIISNYDR